MQYEVEREIAKYENFINKAKSTKKGLFKNAVAPAKETHNEVYSEKPHDIVNQSFSKIIYNLL